MGLKNKIKDILGNIAVILVYVLIYVLIFAGLFLLGIGLVWLTSTIAKMLDIPFIWVLW